MISNFISCDIVIAKILSDLDIQEDGQRITDIREWIFEAIEKIGAITQYDKKESGIDGVPFFKLNNYQSHLPADFDKVLQVAYSPSGRDPWTIMRAGTSSFKLNHNHADRGELVKKASGSMNDDLNDLYSYLNTDLKSPIGAAVRREDLQYFIKPGFITTNKKEGYLKLVYSTVVTDERGYPMLPSAASYQEAVYWYVVMKLKFPEFLKGNINEKMYTFIQNRWNFYRNQAYAEAIMPNEGDLISIKNGWLQLYPEVFAERSLAHDVGRAQRIYNW